MSFLELAKKRYSVRKYLSQQVELKKLEQILEAGRVAPTGANRQVQRLIVVQRPENLQKISLAANIFAAPLAIIVCGDHSSVWKRSYDNKNLVDIDTSIVTDHMMLQATDLGLGTVWICHFNPDIIRNEFAIPKNLEPVSILAIGYAAEEAQSSERHSTTRKALSETVFYEHL